MTVTKAEAVVEVIGKKIISNRKHSREIGGVLGYCVGTIAAYYMGPIFAQIEVSPIPVFIFWAVLISIAISILGSLLPAYFAGKIEPFSNMQEE